MLIKIEIEMTNVKNSLQINITFVEFEFLNWNFEMVEFEILGSM